MVLEATVIIIDNSEWMRNGDYYPSRLDSQNDAVHLVCNAKRQANVENSIALLTMGTDSPKVLVTLTSEQSKLLHAINSVKIAGSHANLLSALQVAQLVLKHRQNSNQRQRIVAFVGSPVASSSENAAFAAIGRFLRKNNIAVDVVAFGNVDDNAEALSALITAVGGDPNANVGAENESHLVSVVPGAAASISNVLLNTPVLAGPEGNASGSFEFGVDPDMDPELAMALKLSLEEEQARLSRRTADRLPAQDVPESNDMQVDEDGDEEGMEGDEEGNEEGDEEGDEEDEDALLQQAIAMSMADQQKQPKDPKSKL